MPWALRVTADRGVGSGVAITPSLVLTCEHVAGASETVRVRTASGAEAPFRVLDTDKDLDVALLGALESAEPLDPGVVVVPRALWRGRWPATTGGFDAVWAESCTDEAETPRRIEIAIQRGHAREARVEFIVQSDRQGVRRGHSGGPVLELHRRSQVPRLFGVVRARDMQSLDLIDNAGAGWFVPMERIGERFDAVATLIETPIERGPDWSQHWEPRSRGVVSHREQGFFYAGRELAYERVRTHVDTGSGLLIVTGARGTGKSALLARVVVRSCARYVGRLGAPDEVQRTSCRPAHQLAAAVFARGRTVDQIASDISAQAGLGELGLDELLAVAERDELHGAVVLDAVDESLDPRILASELARGLAAAGVPVAMAGLRSKFASAAPASAEWIDLDSETYRDPAAIRGYVAGRLASQGRYDEPTATVVARAVAFRARGNFLVAELAGRSLAASPETIDTDEPGWEQQLPNDLTEAFRGYLDRLPGDPSRTLALLHPLGYAIGEGLTLPDDEDGAAVAWLVAANTLRPDTLDPFTPHDLRDIARVASDYLVVSERDRARRLYHEGLADAIRMIDVEQRLLDVGRAMLVDDVAEQQARSHRMFLRALMKLLPVETQAPAAAYEGLDPYVLRYLPAHLAANGRLSDGLERPGLLLCCDPDTTRLALADAAFTIGSAEQPARVAVMHGLAARSRGQRHRAAALFTALRRQGLPDRATEIVVAMDADRARSEAESESPSRTLPRLPYHLLCGPRLPQVVAATPAAHAGTVWVFAVVVCQGQPLVVSAGGDGALRSWWLDGSPGPLQRPDAHRDVIQVLVVAQDAGEPLVITSSFDRALRSWRLDGSVGPLQQPEAHAGWTGALAVTASDGAPLVVSIGGDHAVRSWRLDGSPGPLQREDAHETWITRLAVIHHDSAPLVISAGGDGALRSWRLDGSPGPLQRPSAHSSGITALCALEYEGAPLLVTAGSDRALRSWRLDGTPGPLQQNEAHGAVYGKIGGAAVTNSIGRLAVVEHLGRRLVITAGRGDGVIRSWPLDGSTGRLKRQSFPPSGSGALGVVTHGAEPLVVVGDDSGSLRSWDLKGSAGPLQERDAHTGPVRALAIVNHKSRQLVVTGGDDGAVRSWSVDAPSRSHLPHPGPRSWFTLLGIVNINHTPLAITSGHAGLRSWWLDGTPGPIDDLRAAPNVLTIVDYDDTALLVGAHLEELRSWHLDGSPGPIAYLPQYHSHSIEHLAVVQEGGSPLIVTAGGGGSLRSWRLDGSLGPFQVSDAYSGKCSSLAIVYVGGEPIVVTAGSDNAVRSWRLDGSPGPLQRANAHEQAITSLVVIHVDSTPMIVTAGGDNALRSWWLDGSPGPLQRSDAHGDAITFLAVVRHGNELILVSAGNDHALRSWHLDGSPGNLRHTHALTAMAVAEYNSEPLVIVGERDGAVRSWWLDGAAGPLQEDDIHTEAVTSLAIARHEEAQVVLSTAADIVIVHHLERA